MSYPEDNQLSSVSSKSALVQTVQKAADWLNPKRLRGGLLFALGYLLSPLCWWNDLIFNLPVAYGFGYLCSLISANWMLPGLIIGYWLSNVVGFLLMQFGATDAIQSAKPRSLKKELLTGLLSSTVYTLVVVALVQFHILDPVALLPSELLQFGAWSSQG